MIDASARVAVIVPPVVCHHLDPHTGIPFMPHIAAHFAGALRGAGFGVQVLDSFGLQPHHREVLRELMHMGASEEWLADNLGPNIEVCHIYCRTISEFVAVERLVKAIRQRRPGVRICLFENIQSVNSYSLLKLSSHFLDLGCCAIILGEPEVHGTSFTRCLLEGEPDGVMEGIVYRNGKGTYTGETPPLNEDLDSLPLPAWDIFPLRGYWEAGFAHAPCSRERFLPLLTSRGCPFNCTFCIAPGLNHKWRPRSAGNVVDEIEHMYVNLGVTDFHISDLNPTVNDDRTQAIAREIVKRGLPITWKLAQGTKIETIRSVETLELMAQSGCRFISFSPETGSKTLLKKMKKPFDHEHALRMVKHMNRLGIRTQAVFIAGTPGERDEDRQASIDYVKKLVKNGLDEIQVPIFTPLPGAVLEDSIEGYSSYSHCTSSPIWRKDYSRLLRYRLSMYMTLFIHKFRFPFKVLREVSSILFTRRFETKLEMSLYKQVKLYLLRFAPFFFKRFDAEDMYLKRSGGPGGATKP